MQIYARYYITRHVIFQFGSAHARARHFLNLSERAARALLHLPYACCGVSGLLIVAGLIYRRLVNMSQLRGLPFIFVRGRVGKFAFYGVLSEVSDVCVRVCGALWILSWNSSGRVS